MFSTILAAIAFIILIVVISATAVFIGLSSFALFVSVGCAAVTLIGVGVLVAAVSMVEAGYQRISRLRARGAA